MSRTISFFLILFYCIDIQAQKNLDIINHKEALRIISKHEFLICDTPVVAIIDKGVNLSHEDLKNIIWKNIYEIPNNGIDDDNNGFIDDFYGWNFASNSNDISIGGVGNWHGTPVNGIIGAMHNNIGVKGISPKVKLMNIVKGDSVESIIESLKYVYQMRRIYNETDGQAGAYIVAVNCSWGKNSLWASDYPEWCAMYYSLGSVGVLSVHSVPNENIDIDNFGDMPSTCDSDYLINVTNSNAHDQKIYDAGYGRYSVDLSAPGENTYTTLNTGSYGYFGGTSAAAPYVAGTIGLMYLLPSERFQKSIKNNPIEIASIVKTSILDGVDYIEGFENITTSGGRLNIFKSMKLLCDYFDEQHLYENLFEPFKIISIYPNPATTHTSLIIECDADLDISIVISDVNGNEIFTKNYFLEKGICHESITFSNINEGFYIVRVSSIHTSQSIKLLIQ